MELTILKINLKNFIIVLWLNLNSQQRAQISFLITYTQFTVTVDTKTSAHIYHGSGSPNGYLLNAKVAPFIDLKVGNTYRFDQADSSNNSHPLRFYYDSGKTTAYTTGVTTNGTPGSSGAYTQIVVSETTPNILYYQCSSHALMGSRIDIDSSTYVGASFVDTTGTATNFASTNFAIAQAVALGQIINSRIKG